MIDSLVRAQIAQRLLAASVQADNAVLSGLERYLGLLARWNARINLTALPLRPPTEAALDKLLVEPLLAAPFFPGSASAWIDLGSGGGSPALPLRLACGRGPLTLVESRERKCAFLREAIRAMALEDTSVTTARFEAFHVLEPVDVVTVRAVRIDQDMEALVRRILKVGGSLFCFGTPLESTCFASSHEVSLPDGSILTIAVRVA